MLDLDADRRLTAEQALSHPYLATYADPEDEVITSNMLILLTAKLLSFPRVRILFLPDWNLGL